MTRIASKASAPIPSKVLDKIALDWPYMAVAVRNARGGDARATRQLARNVLMVEARSLTPTELLGLSRVAGDGEFDAGGVMDADGEPIVNPAPRRLPRKPAQKYALAFTDQGGDVRYCRVGEPPTHSEDCATKFTKRDAEDTLRLIRIYSQVPEGFSATVVKIS